MWAAGGGAGRARGGRRTADTDSERAAPPHRRRPIKIGEHRGSSAPLTRPRGRALRLYARSRGARILPPISLALSRRIVCTWTWQARTRATHRSGRSLLFWHLSHQRETSWAGGAGTQKNNRTCAIVGTTQQSCKRARIVSLAYLLAEPSQRRRHGWLRESKSLELFEAQRAFGNPSFFVRNDSIRYPPLQASCTIPSSLISSCANAASASDCAVSSLSSAISSFVSRILFPACARRACGCAGAVTSEQGHQAFIQQRSQRVVIVRNLVADDECSREHLDEFVVRDRPATIRVVRSKRHYTHAPWRSSADQQPLALLFTRLHTYVRASRQVFPCRAATIL